MVTPDPTKAVLPKDFLWGFATASYVSIRSFYLA